MAAAPARPRSRRRCSCSRGEPDGGRRLRAHISRAGLRPRQVQRPNMEGAASYHGWSSFLLWREQTACTGLVGMHHTAPRSHSSPCSPRPLPTDLAVSVMGNGCSCCSCTTSSAASQRWRLSLWLPPSPTLASALPSTMHYIAEHVFLPIPVRVVCTAYGHTAPFSFYRRSVALSILGQLPFPYLVSCPFHTW